jgi:Domain of unknown function (DUF4265)
VTEDVFHTHPHPVWRDRSDFIVAVALPEHRHFEQLWVRRISDDQFEVCCIPLFAADLSLGDVVRTEARNGREVMVAEVVQPSGGWTFRVWLGKSTEDMRSVAEEMSALGALSEPGSAHLLALDVADEASAEALAALLQAGETTGRWIYETGKS